MHRSRNGPYIIFPLPVDNQSYFTPFDIIFQSVFPISFIYSFSYFIILMRIHVVLYSAQVIHGIHGCVSAHARHEFLTQTNGHPRKSSPKLYDISCRVLHDLWPPNRRYFCEMSFTKHFPKFQNMMPVQIGIIMAAYGDRLGIAVSKY